MCSETINLDVILLARKNTNSFMYWLPFAGRQGFYHSVSGFLVGAQAKPYSFCLPAGRLIWALLVGVVVKISSLLKIDLRLIERGKPH